MGILVKKFKLIKMPSPWQSNRRNGWKKVKLTGIERLVLILSNI